MSKTAINNFLSSGQTLNQEIKTSSYSFIDMILQADLFVQIVMLFLLLLSLITWTIVINRYSLLKKINKELQIIDSFLSNNNFNIAVIDNNNFSLIKKLNYFGEILLSIHNKVAKTKDKDKNTNKSIITNDMEISVNNINSLCENNLFWLGTISSSAPFIGLLGTVWGIMNSFQSIAMANNSSINAVAPGIAEALLATAMGLVVAIPALIFNNWIYSKLDYLNERIHNLSKSLLINLDL